MMPLLPCYRCRMVQQITAELNEIESLHGLNMTEEERFKYAGRMEMQADLNQWRQRPCSCRAKDLAS